MLGAIVGDVVGSYYEDFPTKSTNFDLYHPESYFSDDTVLTLAVAKWLIEDPLHTHANLIKNLRYVGWHHLGAGYGKLFYCWLRSDNPRPYNAFSNGCAMRVSPVGLYANSLEETLNLAKISAEVTHNHPDGIKGAQAIAACVFMCKHGESKDAIKNYIETTFGYNLDRRIDDIRTNYNFDVSCNGSVPEAIISFLEGKSFEETLRLAISLGGDSDTIAAMACSIAACCYEIPLKLKKWCYEKLSDDLKKILYDFHKFAYHLPYKNRPSRSTPGLVIYMINQSQGMSELSHNDGLTFAELAAIQVNKDIAEIFARYTIVDDISPALKIAVITYGNNDGATLQLYDDISNLSKNVHYRVENKTTKLSDGSGGFIDVEFELRMFVEPKYSDSTSNLEEAFILAEKILAEYCKNDYPYPADYRFKPIPLIFNITCECDNMEYSQLESVCGSIQRHVIYDGNPLIINNVLSNLYPKSIVFDDCNEDLSIGISNLRSISSNLPETIYKGQMRSELICDYEEGRTKCFLLNYEGVLIDTMFPLMYHGTIMPNEKTNYIDR